MSFIFVAWSVDGEPSGKQLTIAAAAVIDRYADDLRKYYNEC
jgi:hypothetical protein